VRCSERSLSIRAELRSSRVRNCPNKHGRASAHKLNPFFLDRNPTEVSEEFGDQAESKVLLQPRAAPVVSNDVLIWQRLREQWCGEAAGGYRADL
jgi:hypothetical protein